MQSQKLLVQGERISAIGFISVNVFLDCHTVRGTVNGDVIPEVCCQNIASSPHAI